RKDLFDVNDAVNEVIALARSEAGENGVSIQTRLTEGLSSVQGDRVQLQQVVLNLILNAVEAMSAVDGVRELLISSEQSQSDGVLVAVRDSDRASIRDVLSAFLKLSIRPRPAALAWGFQSADPSSKRMEAGYGRPRTNLGVPHFSSPCQARKRNSLPWPAIRPRPRQVRFTSESGRSAAPQR